MIHQVGDGLKHDLQGARMVVRDFTYNDAIGGHYRALCVAPDVGVVRRYLTFHRSPFGSRVNRGLRG